ncbi:class I SAM-dependent methyltransferase [Cytobacillus sp. FJAT-54145]|uniref:Class I SAM-dependent methyltransferase n=1 Tax=Cytobacillus spartinae TaxID=3299023 RepID=A0ABW6KGJ3_9BACI
MKVTYQDALAYYGISGAHPGGLSLTKKLLQNEKITKNTKILDAGCGTGQTAAYIAKTYSCSVTALDHHPLMIRKAKERFKKEGVPVHLVQGSIEQLPFQNHTFDIILVESVTAFTNIPRSLKEFYRVLKPGGCLVDSEMTAEVIFNQKDKETIMSVYGISNILTEQQWLQALRDAGFKAPNVLDGSTVFEEMMKNSPQSDAPNMMEPVPPHPQYEEVMFEHGSIIALYGQKLGYRVIRSVK